MPARIISNTVTIAVTGTAEVMPKVGSNAATQIAAAGERLVSITLQADAANTTNIQVGNSGVVAGVGFDLLPGQSLSLAVTDLRDLAGEGLPHPYVVGTNPAVINYIAIVWSA